MKVRNQKCILKLSLKSLYANRRRNLIAIFAIALTTLLFTSMFTIVLSLNASYETYQFRQVGGYAHGTFKDVSPEQAERIAAHPKVKAAGARKVIGITVDGVFSKTPAEISYMDANCTKWSYATPTTGRMPESGKEAAMDTAALQLLGVTPELGAEVTVSYSITDKDQIAFTVTDTFTLAFVLSLAVGPLAGKMLGSMFWFFEYRFTVLPVLLTIPVFLLLGWLIPCMMYDNAAKCSIVDQLRDAQ